MATNMNYTADPCENIPNNCPWSLIEKYEGGYMPKVVIVTNKAQ
jgi:hypothetical protein